MAKVIKVVEIMIKLFIIKLHHLFHNFMSSYKDKLLKVATFDGLNQFA